MRPSPGERFWFNKENLDLADRMMGIFREIGAIKGTDPASAEAPKSKAGNRIVLKALMGITLGVAACSVSEGKRNSGRCSPVMVMIG